MIVVVVSFEPVPRRAESPVHIDRYYFIIGHLGDVFNYLRQVARQILASRLVCGTGTKNRKAGYRADFSELPLQLEFGIGKSILDTMTAAIRFLPYAAASNKSE